MRLLDAVGGSLTTPVRTLHRMTREGVAVWPPMVLLVLVTALVHLKPLVRLAMLLDAGGWVVLRRVRDVFTDALRTDALVLAATTVVFAGLARLLARGRMLPSRAAAAAVWLLMPLVLLRALGGVLESMGLDLWWLPHHAVDSWAVLVGRQVSWWRFTVKCVTAYGIPLLVALSLARRFRSQASIFSEPPIARGRAGVVAVAVALALLLGTEAWSAARALDRLRPTLADDPLPDATLRTLDTSGPGKGRLRLSQLKGKVVLLDFWASWCAPCRRSIPDLSALAQELGPRGLVVVGVNREPHDIPAATQALQELKPAFQMVLDERGYGDRLGLTSLPTSYVVDREGMVRHLHFGYTEPAVLRSEVEALLGTPTMRKE